MFKNIDAIVRLCTLCTGCSWGRARVQPSDVILNESVGEENERVFEETDADLNMNTETGGVVDTNTNIDNENYRDVVICKQKMKRVFFALWLT